MARTPFVCKRKTHKPVLSNYVMYSQTIRTHQGYYIKVTILFIIDTDITLPDKVKCLSLFSMLGFKKRTHCLKSLIKILQQLLLYQLRKYYHKITFNR